jgi:hypothetical protein
MKRRGRVVGQVASETGSMLTTDPEIHRVQTVKPLATMPAPSSNLQIADIRHSEIVGLVDQIWINRPQQQDVQKMMAILIDISNAPQETETTMAANTKASLILEHPKGKIVSPLFWLNEYTNTVTIGPADRKAIVLAVGDIYNHGLAPTQFNWSFIMNPRNSTSDKQAISPESYYWAGQLPPNCPLILQLASSETGKIFSTFNLVWNWNNNAPIPQPMLVRS